jgi:hypothetical protein
MTDPSPSNFHDLSWHNQAVFGNYAERAPQAQLENLRIWAYTDQISYGPGDMIQVHVNTNGPAFEIELLHDGVSQTVVYQSGPLTGVWRMTPQDCSVLGCDWPLSLRIPVASRWPSGGYILRATVLGQTGVPTQYDHIIIIRPAPDLPKHGRLLLIAATASWTAYNDWGGSNHYQGLCGPNANAFSPLLSIHRPYAKGFVTLPEDAPRAVLTTPPPMATAPQYPHMAWAFANGYSKKYASAGWASFERHFVQFATRAGFALDIISQTDLHRSGDLLQDYACVIMVGHDEYWSWEMRDHMDAYVNAGGNVARFAGNFMWQIRLEENASRQVCYKYTAPKADPVMVTGPRHLVTESWEVPALNRPGAASFGLDATRGMYASWSGCSPRGAKGFPIYRPDHWAFAGTGLYYGDVLGAESCIFGYEVDGLAYEMRDGLPYALSPQPHHRDFAILGLGLSSTLEEGDTIKPGETFLGSEDAEYVATVLEGEATPATIAKTKRGSGLIVNFKSGLGEVFHAGSTDWIAGLIRHDPLVEQVTSNVLNRYLNRT